MSYRSYPLVIDGSQWGTNIYFQNSGWGFRSNNTWYNNGASSNNSWLLFKNMKKDDIVVIRILAGALATVNATYSEKYTYSNHFAYVVDEDGDVELRFQRGGSSPNTWNNTLYGIDQYTTTLSVTIGASGYSTFSSDYALNFDESGIIPYYAKSAADGIITMKEMSGDIAAGTALFLKGTANETYSINVVNSGSEPATTNLLKPTTGSDIYNDSKYQYVYAKKNDGDYGFYKVGSSLSPAKGKAYLETETSAAGTSSARMSISFEDDSETTGISQIENGRLNTENSIYNLNGQRVAKPSRGLYIVNGKKVIKK